MEQLRNHETCERVLDDSMNITEEYHIATISFTWRSSIRRWRDGAVV